MPDRILDLSDTPCKVGARNSLLVLSAQDAPDLTIPLEDLAAVVAAHPQISFSHPALSALASHQVALIVCDSKYLPSGMFLPLEGHFVQTERFAQQAAASVPTRKRCWAQVIRLKIATQGAALEAQTGSDAGLRTLSGRVKSGDPSNLEAQASRKYWERIFGDRQFRRDRQAGDQNRHLNYGYAILRGITARAICGAGLHPSLGLHHKNRYNPFCLADDLMEPWRPLVDLAVARWIADHDPEDPLDQTTRRWLLEQITGRYLWQGEWRTLFDCIARVASSLAQVYAGERKTLLLPELDQLRPLEGPTLPLQQEAQGAQDAPIAPE
ncbi:MAG: CRISPR-associated endonuclease Cas1 [bacterium]|nr:CRISPR-associated endonuclease Cas1 [bacterium]